MCRSCARWPCARFRANGFGVGWACQVRRMAAFVLRLSKPGCRRQTFLCSAPRAGFHAEKEKGRCSCNGLLNLVPRRGLEPPRCYSLVPETSASTNSATWAFQERFELCGIKNRTFQKSRKYLFPETCCVGPAASHNHITRPLR